MSHRRLQTAAQIGTLVIAQVCSIADLFMLSLSALLSLDAVRLQHLRILLAAGGGSRDEEAEQMVPQVST